MSLNAPSGKRLQAFSYDDFQGVDSSRDVASLDTGQQQHLSVLNNGYANFRGIILRDRGATQRKSAQGDRLIKHVTFFGRNLAAWAQRDDGGTTLKAEPNGLTQSLAYPKDAVVSSTIFNNKLITFSRQQPMYEYDGSKWSKNANERERPAFGVAIQRRLAIAGGVDRRTTVDFSRMDNTEIFTRDEPEGSLEVTRAGDIDIRNIIGTFDEIKGLGVFENSRLAVFTNDQALVYAISPDITRWVIDEKTSVRKGTVSHNSIANTGNDLLFASRSGVESLRRSDNNGVTIFSVPMSAKIEELYKRTLRLVPNVEDISAFYDPDYGQYHLFMPQSDILSTRFTMTMGVDGNVKWSTGSFLNARCGASLGGVTILGTNGGIFDVNEYEEQSTVLPELEVVTPILWHGSLTETKKTSEFILQASGKGRLLVDCYNEDGKKFYSMQIDLDKNDNGDDNRTFLALSNQYSRSFEHEYKGVQFHIRAIGGSDRIKIIGLAVMVEVVQPIRTK